MSHEKGPDVLIHALDYLRDLRLTVSFIGDGRQRRKLEGGSIESGPEHQVVWHGAVQRADRLFKAFDLFVLSSRDEGTPLVLFEAIAAGVPVVATRVGGIPDAVSSSEALLVPPNDPRALADAIRMAYTDLSAAAERARAARERLDSEFSLRPWLERYLQVYREVSGIRNMSRAQPGTRDHSLR